MGADNKYFYVSLACFEGKTDDQKISNAKKYLRKHPDQSGKIGFRLLIPDTQQANFFKNSQLMLGVKLFSTFKEEAAVALNNPQTGLGDAIIFSQQGVDGLVIREAMLKKGEALGENEEVQRFICALKKRPKLWLVIGLGGVALVLAASAIIAVGMAFHLIPNPMLFFFPKLPLLATQVSGVLLGVCLAIAFVVVSGLVIKACSERQAFKARNVQVPSASKAEKATSLKGNEAEPVSAVTRKVSDIFKVFEYNTKKEEVWREASKSFPPISPDNVEITRCEEKSALGKFIMHYRKQVLMAMSYLGSDMFGKGYLLKLDEPHVAHSMGYCQKSGEFTLILSGSIKGPVLVNDSLPMYGTCKLTYTGRAKQDGFQLNTVYVKFTPNKDMPDMPTELTEASIAQGLVGAIEGGKPVVDATSIGAPAAK